MSFELRVWGLEHTVGHVGSMPLAGLRAFRVSRSETRTAQLATWHPVALATAPQAGLSPLPQTPTMNLNWFDG